MEPHEGKPSGRSGDGEDKGPTPPEARRLPEYSHAEDEESPLDAAKGGGTRPVRDGQESDAERMQKLEAMVAEQQLRAQEALRPPSRDEVPPRDWITGVTADYGNIMELKPGTGENMGDREAFAQRVAARAGRDKQEGPRKAAWDQEKKPFDNDEGGAGRRDVTAQFDKGRSLVGGSGKSEQSPGRQRDVTGRDRNSPEKANRTSGEFQRDITGRGSGERLEPAGASGSLAETHRDITRHQLAPVEPGKSPSEAPWRDVTGRARPRQ
jgi:hypothetical protein